MCILHNQALAPCQIWCRILRQGRYPAVLHRLLWQSCLSGLWDWLMSATACNHSYAQSIHFVLQACQAGKSVSGLRSLLGH